MTSSARAGVLKRQADEDKLVADDVTRVFQALRATLGTTSRALQGGNAAAGHRGAAGGNCRVTISVPPATVCAVALFGHLPFLLR